MVPTTTFPDAVLMTSGRDDLVDDIVDKHSSHVVLLVPLAVRPRTELNCSWMTELEGHKGGIRSR